MTLGESVTYAGFRIAWWCGAHVPERLLRKFFDSVAVMLWRLHGDQVRRLEFNLSRVTGLDPASTDVRLLSRKALGSYFHYWCEMFVLSHLSDEQIRNRTRLEGAEHIDAALAQGRGVMFAATHSGSWDVAAAGMTQRYGTVMTVAERLKPERLYQMFTRSRERFNFNIIPHVGGDKPPTEILTERLQAGGLVGLASDRDLKGRGVKVDMFGHPVRLPLGAVRLARATGAALLPAAVYYEGDITVMRIYPEIVFAGLNEREGYEALARAFEEILSAHPEAWHMLQPVWLDHPAEWGAKK